MTPAAASLAAAWGVLVALAMAARRPLSPARRVVDTPPIDTRAQPVTGRRRLRHPSRAVSAVLAVLLALSGGAALVAAGAVAVWLVPRGRALRRARDARSHAIATLPEVLDLLSLAVGAGSTAASALRVLADRVDAPWAAAFRTVCVRQRAGAPFAESLDALVHVVGEPAEALRRALVDHQYYGVPLVPALERLTLEARLARRRHAEEAARKVPIALLFPLVVCVLPAFVLLTVVPLLVGATSSLRL